jgi:hypothetical protein
LRRAAYLLLGATGVLIGAGLGGSWLYFVVAKFFQPGRVGLWKLADPTDDWSFSLGAVDAPGARELLGWWLIPVGLALGIGLLLLARRFGRWSIVQMRVA